MVSRSVNHPPLALTPHQSPARALEIVRPRISLDDGSKVDIENTRITVSTSTLGPLEIGGTGFDGDVVFDIRSRACERGPENALVDKVSHIPTAIMYRYKLRMHGIQTLDYPTKEQIENGCKRTHSIPSFLAPIRLRDCVQLASAAQLYVASVRDFTHGDLPPLASSCGLDMDLTIVCVGAAQLAECERGAVSE